MSARVVDRERANRALVKLIFEARNALKSRVFVKLLCPGKRGLLEKDFQNVHFLETLEMLEIPENPQTMEKPTIL